MSTSKQLNLKLMKKSFVFVREGACQAFRVTLAYGLNPYELWNCVVFDLRTFHREIWCRKCFFLNRKYGKCFITCVMIIVIIEVIDIKTWLCSPSSILTTSRKISGPCWRFLRRLWRLHWPPSSALFSTSWKRKIEEKNTAKCPGWSGSTCGAATCITRTTWSSGSSRPRTATWWARCGACRSGTARTAGRCLSWRRIHRTIAGKKWPRLARWWSWRATRRKWTWRCWVWWTRWSWRWARSGGGADIWAARRTFITTADGRRNGVN